MSVLDRYFAYKFIYLLTQNWEDTESFKAGIIDKEGNIIKTSLSMDEKNIFTKFHKVVYKIKQLLDKVPFAKSTMGKFATAILLLREDCNTSEIEKAFLEHVQNEYDYVLPSVNQIVLEHVNNTDHYAEVFGVWFNKSNMEIVNDISENSVAGIDITDAPKQKFADDIIFKCNTDTFNKCRLGKRKYLKYSTYVGNDEIGEQIREFGRKYPKKGIILQDGSTGAMLYLRRKANV